MAGRHTYPRHDTAPGAERRTHLYGQSPLWWVNSGETIIIGRVGIA